MENIYNSEGSTLRKHQLRMLEMLKVVDAICNKHNIPYWLSSGTLLGAVRHGGFIPWDDDLDIEIEQKYRLKFMNVMERELPSNLLLQCNKNDKMYINYFFKIRDLNSCIDEFDVMRNRKYSTKYKFNGVFIDVFFVEKSAFVFVDILKKYTMFMYFLKHVLCFPGFLLRVFYYFLILTGCFFRFISSFISTDFLFLSYGSIFTSKRNAGDIFPLQTIKFEEDFYNCPCNYSAYLEKLYGDYNKLPDKTKRVPEHSGNVVIY
jgi:lipopolysaccharide cholinephosphotransferase